ncbi:hypothetical protein [Serratia fonticola]
MFCVEKDRKVSKVNVFAINSERWEYPVYLRGKTIQIRLSTPRALNSLHILAERERCFWFFVNAYSGGKYHDLAP